MPIYRFPSFHKGLNNDANPRDIDDSEVVSLQNLDVTRVGKVTLLPDGNNANTVVSMDSEIIPSNSKIHILSSDYNLNLIKNGSFNKWTGDMPDDWSDAYDQMDTTAPVAHVSGTGQPWYVKNITGTDDAAPLATTDSDILTTTVQLQPNRTYHLSWRYRMKATHEGDYHLPSDNPWVQIWRYADKNNTSYQNFDNVLWKWDIDDGTNALDDDIIRSTGQWLDNAAYTTTDNTSQRFYYHGPDPTYSSFFEFVDDNVYNQMRSDSNFRNYHLTFNTHSYILDSTVHNFATDDKFQIAFRLVKDSTSSDYTLEHYLADVWLSEEDASETICIIPDNYDSSSKYPFVSIQSLNDDYNGVRKSFYYDKSRNPVNTYKLGAATDMVSIYSDGVFMACDSSSVNAEVGLSPQVFTLDNYTLFPDSAFTSAHIYQNYPTQMSGAGNMFVDEFRDRIHNFRGGPDGQVVMGWDWRNMSIEKPLSGFALPFSTVIRDGSAMDDGVHTIADKIVVHYNIPATASIMAAHIGIDSADAIDWLSGYLDNVYFLYTRGLYSSSNVHSEIRKIDSITQVANTASFDGMTLELGLDGNNEVTAATGSTKTGGQFVPPPGTLGYSYEARSNGAAYASETTPTYSNWDVDDDPTIPATEDGSWTFEDAQLGYTYLYMIGNQIVESGITDLMLNSGNSVYSVTAKKIKFSPIFQAPFPRGVIGMRTYIGYSGDWWLTSTIRFDKGVQTNDSNTWVKFTKATFGTNDGISNDARLFVDNKAIFFTSNFITSALPTVTYNDLNGHSPDVEVGFNTAGTYFKTASVGNRRLYLGGYSKKNADDIMETKSDGFIKSPANQWLSLSTDNLIEVAINDGDSIIHMEEFGDRILQFKERTLYIVNIGRQFEFLESKHPFMGVSNKIHVVSTPFGVVWVNNNSVYHYDGKQIHDLIVDKGMRRLDSWAFNITGSIGYEPNEKKVYLRDSSSATGGHIYDFVTKSWTEITAFYTAASKSDFFNLADGTLSYIEVGTPAGKKINVVTGKTVGSVLLKTKEVDFSKMHDKKKILATTLNYTATGTADSKVRVKLNYSTGQGAFVSTDLFGTSASTGLKGTGAIMEEAYDNTKIPASGFLKTAQVEISSFDDVTQTDFEVDSIEFKYRIIGEQTQADAGGAL